MTKFAFIQKKAQMFERMASSLETEVRSFLAWEDGFTELPEGVSAWDVEITEDILNEDGKKLYGAYKDVIKALEKLL